MRNRNIAEILEDDKKGKQLSQTEQRVVTAYTQGKYDAVRELKLDNKSNINEVLDKIKAEIDDYLYNNEFGIDYRADIANIIDKYKESEVR